jgi:hypothetical protein
MSAMGQKQTSVNYFARTERPPSGGLSEITIYVLGRAASFRQALLVSKRIFEKVLVSVLKLILKAKDLKAIVSTDGPKL